MGLKPLTYPFPETRFLHVGPSVYKFKIRYGNSIRGTVTDDKDGVPQELEDSIRVVLGNMDNLQPFATEHFIVFPYKSEWERVSHLKFKHGETVLIPYPFVFTLYLEMKQFHEHLSPGRAGQDSSPGTVLTEKTSPVATVRKRKCMEEPNCSPSPGLARPKMGTSGPSLSRKKPPVTIRRNKQRKTQQEWQETLAVDSTHVQEEDSKWGHSPAEPGATPPQQNNLPPKETGSRGFLEFLSSLFPFQYFFRRNSQ
ncbi:membrane-anchored junction protein [Ochotona curzoniae]|uniref:membrane-anchored junction protein n=1 Tax=Ochotona curzoniae TaxID=130825 RepID=UPI001B34EB8B|nr:membrane-anchored junction protein [Ochotona curzoniae]